MSAAKEPAAVPDNEIRSSRLINFPRELVWTALSDPNHLVNWWGPKGFTNAFHTFDFKVGGQWKFIMHGPDGTDYKNESRFVEIVQPEKIVLDHISEPRFRMIITLDDRSDKTELTWRQIFETSDICRRVRVYAEPANEENFDRLEAQLQPMMASPEFVITREFDAPRDLVWKAWTDPELLKQWFGPKGFTMPACKMDLRVGGVFHYSLVSPDGQMTLWGKWVFREITPPERIVVISSFSDEQQGLTRHPMAPDWPIQLHSTFTLTARGNKTEVKIQWTPLNPTPVELKTFLGGFASMNAGWSGTFSQLEQFLGSKN